jgi:hypothetical protein
LRDCNVGITGGRDLWCASLRWAQMSRYTYQVSYRLVQPFKS